MEPPSASAPISVKRVTLPRYEVTYPGIDLALEHALAIRVQQVFTIGHLFTEPPGQELVLDLTLAAMPTTTTLLFRLIQRTEIETALEWWPRRQTDPDLLDMWVDWLEENRSQAQAPGVVSLPPAEIMGLFDFCRRGLAANAFVALAVHWTASGDEVNQAFESAMLQLLTYKNTPGSGRRAEQLLAKARAGFVAARDKLTTLEQRREARARYVPGHQLAQARELARSKMQIARLQKKEEEYARAALELRELDF